MTQKNIHTPRTTARNIVERHVQKIPNGHWAFTHDTRTYGQRQLFDVSEEQRLELIRNIRCPVLSIEADRPRSEQSQAYYEKFVTHRYSVFRDVTIDVVHGNHHVHSDSPDQVVAAIMRWWKRKIEPKASL
jgi:pimeloyl-ACP methyl ester carboxylesterase